MVLTPEQAAELHRRKQKTRRDVKDFGALIATPANLGNVAAASSSSSVQLPANGRLAVSCSVVVAAGDLSLDIGPNKVLNIPALGANEIYNPNVHGEEGQSITVNRSGAGLSTVTVYVMDGIGRLRPIATATFTP